MDGSTPPRLNAATAMEPVIRFPAFVAITCIRGISSQAQAHKKKKKIFLFIYFAVFSEQKMYGACAAFVFAIVGKRKRKRTNPAKIKPPAGTTDSYEQEVWRRLSFFYGHPKIIKIIRMKEKTSNKWKTIGREKPL